MPIESNPVNKRNINVTENLTLIGIDYNYNAQHDTVGCIYLRSMSHRIWREIPLGYTAANMTGN